MRTKLALPMLFISLICAACDATTPQTQRRHLDQIAAIQGYPCAKGYAWFYADGRLNRCTVTRGLNFGEAWIPSGSIIDLWPDGSTADVMMSHESEVAGLHCSGGGFLGPAEGAMTGFYPSGKLEYCFLAADQIVQGAPCAAGGFWRAMAGHDFPVELYEDGKLKGCGLATGFKGKRRFDRVRFPD